MAFYLSAGATLWPPRRQLAVAWWAPLLCRDDGLNWDAVFNSDGNRAGKEYAVEIDGLLHQTAHQIKDWPAADLYKNYSI